VVEVRAKREEVKAMVKKEAEKGKAREHTIKKVRPPQNQQRMLHSLRPVLRPVLLLQMAIHHSPREEARTPRRSRWARAGKEVRVAKVVEVAEAAVAKGSSLLGKEGRARALVARCRPMKC